MEDHIFKFNITSTWYVAHSHGHSAFRLLKIASDIESEFRHNLVTLGSLPFGRAAYLKLSGKNQELTKEMFRISCASVMMFQAMMEALINDSLHTESSLASVNKNKKLSFKSKWCKALKEVGEKTDSFLTYNDSIYVKFRNPMIHPSPKKLATFDDLSTQVIQSGFYSGWEAFGMLYRGLGHPPDQDSWNTMCGRYGLPTEPPTTPSI